MIERFMDLEHIRDSLEYSQTTKRIVELRHQLGHQLNQEDRELLDHLAGVYLEQSQILIKEAFVSGFCTAAEMALEILRHKSP